MNIIDVQRCEITASNFTARMSAVPPDYLAMTASS
jgi:hypothetical protein